MICLSYVEEKCYWQNGCVYTHSLSNARKRAPPVERGHFPASVMVWWGDLMEWHYFGKFLLILCPNKWGSIPRNNPRMCGQGSEWNIIPGRTLGILPGLHTNPKSHQHLNMVGKQCTRLYFYVGVSGSGSKSPGLITLGYLKAGCMCDIIQIWSH